MTTSPRYLPIDGTDMLGKDARRVLAYFTQEVEYPIEGPGAKYPKPDGEVSKELGIARSYIVRVRKHYNIPDVEKRREACFASMQEAAKNYYNLYTSGVDQYIELEKSRLKEQANACSVGVIIGVIAGALFTVLASILF